MKICHTCQGQFPDDYDYCPKDRGILSAPDTAPKTAFDWIQNRPEILEGTQNHVETNIEKLPTPEAVPDSTQISQPSGLPWYKVVLAILAGAGVVKLIFSIIALPAVTSIAADKIFVVFVFLLIVASAFGFFRLLKSHSAAWSNVIVAILAGVGVSYLANIFLLLRYLFEARSFDDGVAIFAPLESLIPKMNKLGVASAFLAWRLLSGQRWTHIFTIVWAQLKEALSGKEKTLAKRFDPKLAVDSSLASQAKFYIIAAIPAVMAGYLIAKSCYALFVPIFLYNRGGYYIEHPLVQTLSGLYGPTYFNPAVTYFRTAGNFFMRIHVFAGALTAFAAVFTLPKKQKEFLLSRDPIGLAIRANCVSLIVNLVVSALFFINIFREKLSWDTAKQGMPIYWTQIGIGLGLFFLLKHIFMGVKEAKSDDDDDTRGTDRPEEDAEEPYLPSKQPVTLE